MAGGRAGAVAPGNVHASVFLLRRGKGAGICCGEECEHSRPQFSDVSTGDRPGALCVPTAATAQSQETLGTRENSAGG